MINLGSLELGEKLRIARIAAIVDAILPLQDLTALRRKGVDLLEVRVDLFETTLACIVKYLEALRDEVQLPLIGTVRENERTLAAREGIFRAIIPLVDCIDIELGAAIAADVTAEAKLQGKTVMVSEHNFGKTPDDRALQTIVDRALAQGADIVKIATMAANAEDTWRLLHFADSCAVPLVAFAMGEAGAFSRVRACEFGSLFTYGYITMPVAPGQLSAEELIKRMKNEEGRRKERH